MTGKDISVGVALSKRPDTVIVEASGISLVAEKRMLMLFVDFAKGLSWLDVVQQEAMKNMVIPYFFDGKNSLFNKQNLCSALDSKNV